MSELPPARVRTRSFTRPHAQERPVRPRPSLGVAGLDLTIAVSVETADKIDRIARARNKLYPTAPAWDMAAVIETALAPSLDALIERMKL